MWKGSAAGKPKVWPFGFCFFVFSLTTYSFLLTEYVCVRVCVCACVLRMGWYSLLLLLFGCLFGSTRECTIALFSPFWTKEKKKISFSVSVCFKEGTAWCVCSSAVCLFVQNSYDMVPYRMYVIRSSTVLVWFCVTKIKGGQRWMCGK